jgi:hypothetical protein
VCRKSREEEPPQKPRVDADLVFERDIEAVETTV